MPLPSPAPVAAQVRRRLAGHDLPLVAAGLSFYAVIAVVPLVLFSSRLVAAVAGTAWTREQLLRAAALLPPPGDRAAVFFADHGPSLPWGAAVAALLPLGLYGEGLIRAFARLSPTSVNRRPLRGRVAAAGLAVATPVALGLALLAVRVIGRPGLLLGVYLAFLVGWGLATALLALAYRLLTPAQPRQAAVWWPAATIGSVLAGFSLGYVLLLHLRLGVGPVYGGSAGLALAAIAGLWVYGLNLATLAGFAVTLGWDEAAER